MIMKENDYFLNTLANPTFTPLDFNEVGLTPDNTSFETPDTYLRYNSIKNNQAFLNNQGQFDQTKFDKVYNKAAQNYNILTQLQSSSNIGKNKIFHRNDIFAPKEMRKDNVPEYNIAFVGNPHRQQTGFSVFGLKDAPKMSDREIAQTQKVWDPATKQWHDAPNDSFFGDFFETRVLAQYDEDTTDPDGTVHKKGERKIDPNTGTYYYENLNGRDIYGREVLSKFDTLSTDGSFMNKFDFFDSDDIDKSFGGSLVRSAVKVIPAFIPGVAPWYIGARVALGFADVMPKLGKMVVGSDSPVLSEIEGFAHSLGFSNSDHASQNAWSMENILNLGSDVFTQLAEQRWLFQYAPSLMKGSKLGFSKEAQDAFRANKLKELNELNLPFEQATKNASSNAELMAKIQGLQGVNVLRANQALEDEMKSINKLGEYLSKAYMTGVTVADSYSEAKQSGLSDTEAALFTLGYGLGEWGILNTQLGEMILPELRMDRARMKHMIRMEAGAIKAADDTAMSLGKQAAIDATNKQAKGNWIRNWLNKGVNTAKKYFNGELDEKLASKNMAQVVAEKSAEEATKGSVKNAVGITASHLMANALGEGVEEVSEEMLLDFSKTIFNTAAWLAGSNSRLNGWDQDEKGHIQWDKLLSRYGLNFVGGVIGGGLGQGLQSYQDAFKLSGMTQRDAYEELVHLVKEGKGGELKKLARQMTLGNQYHGINVDEAGNYTTAVSGQTQDDYIKNNFDSLIDNIESILNTNNAKISDESLIKHLSGDDQNRILNDLKFLNLSKSDVMGYYVQDFNSIVTDIAKTTAEIKALESLPKDSKTKDSDKEEPLTEDQTKKLQQLKNKLKDLIKQKDDYLNGTMSKEVIKDVLWEGSDAINTGYKMLTSEVNFIQATENKAIKDIPPARLEELHEKWKQLKESGRVRDTIRMNRQIFDFINEKFSQKIKDHDEKYFQDDPDQFLQQLADSLISSGNGLSISGRMATINAENDEDKVLSQSEKFLDTKGTNALNMAQSRRAATLHILLKLLGLNSENDYTAGIDYALNVPTSLTQFMALNDEVKKQDIAKYILFKKALGVDYLDINEKPEVLESYEAFCREHPEELINQLQEIVNTSNNLEQDFPEVNQLLDNFGASSINELEFEDIQDWLESLSPEQRIELIKKINDFNQIQTIELEHSNQLQALIQHYLENNPDNEAKLPTAFASNYDVENWIKDNIAEATALVAGNDTLLAALGEQTEDTLEVAVAKNAEILAPLIKPLLYQLNWDDLTLEGKKLALENYIKAAYDTISDSDLIEIQNKYFNQAIHDFFTDNFDAIVNALSKSRYIKHNIKDFLKTFFKEGLTYGEFNGDPEEGNEEDSFERQIKYEQIQHTVQQEKRAKKISDLLDSLNNSPIEKLLDQFQLSIGDKSVPLSKLIEHLNTQLEQGVLGHDISTFGVDEDMVEALDNAINLLKMLRSHVAAARTDNIDIDNIFGYNKVFNQLMGTDLAQIDKNVANAIIYDLNKLETTLLFYKRLWQANSGQKLVEIAKNNTQFRKVRYQGLKRFIISILPDDDDSWKGLHAVKAALNDNNFSALSKEGPLSEEQQAQAFKELAIAEGAVHDFLVQNIDKLQDKEAYSKIFNSNNFKILTPGNTKVDAELQALDDAQLITYLATLTAIDPRTFYKDLAQVIDPRFAPIDAQIVAVMEAYAFVLNTNTFNIFQKIHNDLVDETIEITNEADLENLRKQGCNILKGSKDTDFHVNYSQHFLVEGIPGAGKSTAVYTLLYKLLEQHPSKDKITKKIWFIHKSVEQAEKAAEEAGFSKDQVICMDRTTYLTKVNSKYKSCISEEGVVDQSLIEQGEDGFWKYKDLNVETVTEPPTLVIIDEATNFSQQDFFLSNDFLTQYGTRAIITGDYEQTSETASFSVEATKTTYMLGTKATNFQHSPKLGISMRSNNLFKTDNINKFNIERSRILNYLLAQSINQPLEITTSYALTDNGLFGDVFTMADPNDEDQLDATTKEVINGMLSTLKEGEKINVVSDSTEDNSPLLKYLAKVATDKYNKIKSTNAQGQEGQYYIVDIHTIDAYKKAFESYDFSVPESVYNNNKQNPELFIKGINDLYTYLSRSSQGTLLVNTDTDAGTPRRVVFKSFRHNSVKSLNISEEKKKQEGLKLKATIEQAISGLELSENKYNELSKTVKTIKAENEEDEDPNESDLNEAREGNSHYIDTDGTQELMNTFQCTETGLNCVLENGEPTYYLPNNAHQYIPEETRKDADGEVVYRGGDVRHDNANGILNLGINVGQHVTEKDGKIKIENAEGLITKVAYIRNAITYTNDPDELLGILQDQLKGAKYPDGTPRKPTKVSFAFKAAAPSFTEDEETYDDSDTSFNTWETKNGNYVVSSFRNFWKGVQEWVYGALGVPFKQPGQRDKRREPRNKNVVAIITDQNGKIMYETSIFGFPNPITLMHRPGYENILEAWNNFEPETPGNKVLEFAEILKQGREEGKFTNSAKLEKLLRVYAIGTREVTTEDGRTRTLAQFICRLTNERNQDFLPARDMQALGMYATVKPRGTQGVTYEDEGWENNAQPMSLSDLKIPGRSISSQVYAATKVDEGFNSDIKAGQPFVLMADSHKSMSDTELVKRYNEQLQNPSLPKIVRRILVTPPSVSIEDWFQNFSNIINTSKNPDLPISHTKGNKLTPFRILWAITNENSTFSKTLEKENPDAEEEFFDKTSPNAGMLDYWKKVRKVVQYLGSLTPEERIKALDTDIETGLTGGLFKSGTIELTRADMLYTGADENKEISMYRQNMTLGKFLNSVLIDYVISRNWKTANAPSLASNLLRSKHIQRRIDVIAEDLKNPDLNRGLVKADGTKSTKDIVIDKILYNLPFKAVGNGGDETQLSCKGNLTATIVPLNIIRNGDSYTYQGKELQVLGKIDTNLYFGNSEVLLNQILNVYEDLDKTDEQLKKYIESGKATWDDVSLGKKSIWDKFTDGLSETLKKKLSGGNPDEVLKIDNILKNAWDNGYIIVNLGGKYKIIADQRTGASLLGKSIKGISGIDSEGNETQLITDPIKAIKNMDSNSQFIITLEDGSKQLYDKGTLSEFIPKKTSENSLGEGSDITITEEQLTEILSKIVNQIGGLTTTADSSNLRELLNTNALVKEELKIILNEYLEDGSNSEIIPQELKDQLNDAKFRKAFEDTLKKCTLFN